MFDLFEVVEAELLVQKVAFRACFDPRGQEQQVSQLAAPAHHLATSSGTTTFGRSEADVQIFILSVWLVVKQSHSTHARMDLDC